MPTFAVIGFDRRPKEHGARDAIRADHRTYVETKFDPVVLAGALLDDDGSQCGTLYVFEAETIADVHAWLDEEPFVANGIYETLAVREVEIGRLWTLPPKGRAATNPR